MSINEIRERLSKATPGPWRRTGSARHIIYQYDGGDDMRTVIGEIWGCGNIQDVDADFIAHAPEDIKFLLAEVERLEAELQHYRQLKDEGRLVELPVPIGGSLWVAYEITETDGSIDRGVEEVHLSGYIREGDREFYTTFDESGTCDFAPDQVYLTPEAADRAKGVVENESNT